MKRYLVAAVATMAVVASAQAYGHHSFAATYLETQSITIEGELVQFLFRNPHSFIHVLVKEKDGSNIRYTVEWGGAGQLGGQGVTRTTFEPGDFIVVTGSPGRNPIEHRVRMVALSRPKDGFSWGRRTGEVVD